jgi:hypothetical protein
MTDIFLELEQDWSLGLSYATLIVKDNLRYLGVYVLNDTSEVENSQTPRKTLWSKNPICRRIAYLAMLLLFGFTVIGMLWFMFVLGYEMRYQDWIWFGFNVLGTLAGIGALWEEWRMRRRNLVER